MKKLESGEMVGMLSYDSSTKVAKLVTKVSGGSLPAGFSTLVHAEFDFSDLSEQQLMEYAVEAARIRVRSLIWTAKNGSSASELRKYDAANPCKIKLADLERRAPATASIDKIVERSDATQLTMMIAAAQAKLSKMQKLKQLNASITRS